jgi:SPP1 family predicted phage head-tail adaptor
MAYQRRRTPIGRRRDRVQIQSRTTASDGIGGQTVTWATVATTWAQIVPLDGRDQEAVEGGQLTVSHAYHFDLRYRHGTRPAPTMRLVWRSRTFEIRTVVDDDAMRERIVVQCAEVQDSNAAA